MDTTTAHLLSRHLDPSSFRCVVDEEANIVTFYLFNLSGSIVGYQQYRPGAPKTFRNDPKDGRYFTHITKPNFGVWGLESFHYREDILFIVEGIFDAVRLHNLGLPAIAILANCPNGMNNWLMGLGRWIVVIADDDKAGKELLKFGDAGIICPGSHDLGGMTDDEVRTLLTHYL
jgi:DNA primase